MAPIRHAASDEEYTSTLTLVLVCAVAANTALSPRNSSTGIAHAARRATPRRWVTVGWVSVCTSKVCVTRRYREWRTPVIHVAHT